MLLRQGKDYVNEITCAWVYKSGYGAQQQRASRKREAFLNY
jgi:hypothetical protein